MTQTPATVRFGGSLTTDGTDIYALRGNSTNQAWKYTVSTNSWSSIANTPDNIAAGGALAYG
jgi:hypothetical protein